MAFPVSLAGLNEARHHRLAAWNIVDVREGRSRDRGVSRELANAVLNKLHQLLQDN
jgi:hypothetical protein